MEIGASSQLGASIAGVEKANGQVLKAETGEEQVSSTQVSQDDAVNISAEAMAAYSASLNDSGVATTNGTGVTPPPPPGGGTGTKS